MYPAFCIFDGVVCVEVIEHVFNDELFVQQVVRVLKPGGWLYLTTPNGDYIRNEPPHYNPDHIRHYTQKELSDLLWPYFKQIRVTWGVKTGRHRYEGLKSLNLQTPVASLKAMGHNIINQFESRDLIQHPQRRAHLFAVAFKGAV